VIKLNYRFVNKGEWEKQQKAILYVERKCFRKEERTYPSWYRELINDAEPFVMVVRDGRKAIGCFVCAPLEESGKDLKRWDKKNFGKKNTLYIISIGVIPEYRNAGVGRGMMHKLLQAAHRDYDRVALHTRSEEFRGMAIRHGFRIVKYGRMDNTRMAYMVKWLR
jgi:ribosomal protein S18 acetylase RimI-like enzyme